MYFNLDLKAPPPPVFTVRDGGVPPPGKTTRLTGVKCKNLLVKEKNEQEHKDTDVMENLGKRSVWCLKGKRGHDCK